MKKRVFRILGVSFLLIGFVLVLNSLQGITGYVVFEGADFKAGTIYAIWFLVAGGVLILMARHTASPLTILISNKALERARDDPRVRNNMPAYVNRIRTIAANPIATPDKEKIGDFNISPHQRHTDRRVAWHFDGSTNTLFIDDLLYHVSQEDYNDRWNKKARKGTITREDYSREGYSAFKG